MISIKSVQTVDDSQDITELLTTGRLYRHKGTYLIAYNESTATGYEGSKTTLRLTDDGSIHLKRSGSTSSNLIIEKGKKHHCHYGTLYGDFMVGIATDQVSSTLSDAGGDLYFKYTVDINASYMSENEIFVNVKECKTSDGIHA